MSSKEFTASIARVDFSGCAATVVGYGSMGQQYIRALRILGVGQIRVCSRSENPLKPLKNLKGITTKSGGYQQLDWTPSPGELAIVATPTLELVSAASHLAKLGFRKILIEKPVSLHSTEIQKLTEIFQQQQVQGVCAYNRVAYPSFLELVSHAESEGGITSCTYTITEIIKEDWEARFSPEDLARWGIANSMHVVSMAHGLIGAPKCWDGRRSGSISWHPPGSVFVGSGVSDREIPFSYHGDWGSKGRWSVEAHTDIASYRLCPLENLFRKESAMGDWQEIPVSTFASGIKTGIVEEVAAMLDLDLGETVPLMTLEMSTKLTRYAESVFGYSSD